MPSKPPVRLHDTKPQIRKPLNTIFTFLGAVFLLFILIWVGAQGYSAYMGNVLNPSSKEYVDESIPAIISTWSRDELVKRASPELRAIASNGQLDQLIATCAKLGTFQSYNGAIGRVNINISLQNGQVITASYIANATFKNGKAEIQIKLIRHNGAWQLLGFHVNSPMFEQ